MPRVYLGFASASRTYPLGWFVTDARWPGPGHWECQPRLLQSWFMNDPFILVVGGVLLLVGSVIALAWWKLAKKAAPYRDEQQGPAGPTPTDDAEVIVIGKGSETKRGG